MFEETGRVLNQYKDFITNGLDLLSFLLLTPDLVKLANPYHNVNSLILIVLYFVGGWAFLSFLGILSSALASWYSLSSIGGLAVGMIIGICIAAAIAITKESAPPVFRWFRRHAFVIGVILFLFSRFFAFAMASFDLFFESSGAG